MARLKMAEIPRNANPTRVRNRCATTGRPRGYYRKFGLCRIELQEPWQQGHDPRSDQVELVRITTWH